MKIKQQTAATLAEYLKEHGGIKTTSQLNIPLSTIYARINSDGNWFVMELEGKIKAVKVD